MECVMQLKTIRKNRVHPKVKFSPEYMDEIQMMTVEKSYLLAHRLAHKKNNICDIHVPKKYNEVANKYADLVMYTLKLEMAYIRIRAEAEKKKQEYNDEENKRWRFIFDLFERHNLDETKELKYMEE